ncbi:hypothetical protein [Sphaerisporangium corydalis]|uniref:Uncharacterized protein n=1 Tax=Sphaerisporangium corydalis TaxID=1441875 RepID=A0ABV9EPV2_9ACTN|nr:hypothetical protein [Sphaerisporangium corydalis]
MEESGTSPKEKAAPPAPPASPTPESTVQTAHPTRTATPPTETAAPTPSKTNAAPAPSETNTALAPSETNATPSEKKAASRRRTLLLAPGFLITGIVAVLSLALIIVLIVGVTASAWHVAILLAASVGVAVVVVRLPASVRTRFSLLVAAFVATIGVIPALSSDDKPAEPLKQANVSYLADLVRKGPFTEKLPPPITTSGFKDVMVSDAPDKVDAVALELSWPDSYDPFPDFDGPEAHIEIYSTPQKAAERARRRLETLKMQYQDSGSARGTATGFAVSNTTDTTAGGTRGYAYVEAYAFGPSNADIALATSTITAILRYTDRLTAQATT